MEGMPVDMPPRTAPTASPAKKKQRVDDEDWRYSDGRSVSMCSLMSEMKKMREDMLEMYKRTGIDGGGRRGGEEIGGGNGSDDGDDEEGEEDGREVREGEEEEREGQASLYESARSSTSWDSGRASLLPVRGVSKPMAAAVAMSDTEEGEKEKRKKAMAKESIKNKADFNGITGV